MMMTTTIDDSGEEWEFIFSAVFFHTFRRFYQRRRTSDTSLLSTHGMQSDTTGWRRLLHTEIIFPFQIKWLFSLPVRPLLLLNPFQPCSENFNFDCMFNPLRNTVRIEWANNSTWIFFDSRKNEKVLYSLAVWGGKIPAQPTTSRAISNNKMWKTESRSFERRRRFLTVQKESKKSQVLCFIR